MKHRWSARIVAVKLLVKKPREILHSLHTLKKDFDIPGDLYNEVTLLTTRFQSFEFVVLAIFWFKTLQAVNDVICLLQGTKLTLDEEIRLLKALLNDLQCIRELWSVLIGEASVLATILVFEECFKQKRLRFILMKTGEMPMNMLMKKRDSRWIFLCCLGQTYSRD